VSHGRWIVVPAAGFGQRMGGSTPKQYLALGDHSILQRTLDQLLMVPDIDGVVVVLAANDTRWPALAKQFDSKVHTTTGGETRADSVTAGLRYVLEQARPDTWVFVHDAARPLVQVSDIQRLSDAVMNSGSIGGLLGTPVQDTLKMRDEYFGVERTVSRDALWQAQTPQLFNAAELLEAMLAGASSEITDESSAMELAGHAPLLVEALEPNFKITRPVDLRIANALLNNEVVVS